MKAIRCFRILFMIFFLVLYVKQMRGQEVHEIGLQGGASAYLGDFNHINIFKSPSFCGGAFYRRLFDDYNSIRLSVGAGMLSGSSKNIGSFLPRIPPEIEFSRQYINVDVKYEVNFIPFNPLRVKDDFFSPYLLVGIGCYFYDDSIIPAIPFGAGIKIAASPRLTMGVEVQLSKTFNDKLDGYSNVTSGRSVLINNDWFAFYGLVLSYRLKLGQKTCPAYL
ncbi:type IX secretion system protein PorG [Acetobacteroides hydrogenigenes]|uniref:DUF6089 domain-containing protein n=1 Tax=Acetobacteroides hydrogenigenes TaxID=979970 RepID=A0A4R2EZ81_9BACT|nr:DUF6089 family protein [Acetobacteroides hydrogenigenes]TCN72943.1 hypothetical protein CLV25_101161 [Acetobacteroides hydrogenigenes]